MWDVSFDDKCAKAVLLATRCRILVGPAQRSDNGLASIKKPNAISSQHSRNEEVFKVNSRLPDAMMMMMRSHQQFCELILNGELCQWA